MKSRADPVFSNEEKMVWWQKTGSISQYEHVAGTPGSGAAAGRFPEWRSFSDAENTKVLNVSLTDNTCYVNLDSGFISGDTDVAEYIPIYAIVDSLTELQTVNKVQITVNGSADVTYRNVISLAQPLEREEKYIVK